jgi:cation transport ATPase
MSNMTADQLEILDVYRQLCPEQKSELIRYTKAVLKQQQGNDKPKARKETGEGGQ